MSYVFLWDFGDRWNIDEGSDKGGRPQSSLQNRQTAFAIPSSLQISDAFRCFIRLLVNSDIFQQFGSKRLSA